MALSPSGKTLGDLYEELQDLDTSVLELRDGAVADREAKLREIHLRENGFTY